MRSIACHSSGATPLLTGNGGFMQGRALTLGGVAALLALAAAALMAFAALAPDADAKKKGKKKGGKPDLIVEGQATTLQEYLFREDGEASFTDRTANVGKGKAKPSNTALMLIHAPQVDRTPVATRAVPKLKGGKSDFGTGGGALAGELPPGEYFAFICADFDDRVKEKKEGNNCLALEERVYVIEREWAGQLDGSGPTASGGSTTESWTSADASFQFSEYLGDGRFKYLFHGSVTYTVSGTDSEGCTYSGSDTTSLAGNAAGEGLILDLRKEEYFGGQGVPGFPFNWDYVCEGVPSQIGGPLSIAGGFIVVNPQEIDTHPLPFGSTTLTGSSTSDFNGSTFGWLLG